MADYLESLPRTDSLRQTELMVHLIGSDDRMRAAKYYSGELTAAEEAGATGEFILGLFSRRKRSLTTSLSKHRLVSQAKDDRDQEQKELDQLEAELDDLNARTLAALTGSGYAMVSSTRVDGRFALRFCILNHRTGPDDVLGVLARVRAQGMTICIIEHTMHAMMRLADRFVVLDHGRVLATGLPGAVDDALDRAAISDKSERGRLQDRILDCAEQIVIAVFQLGAN